MRNSSRREGGRGERILQKAQMSERNGKGCGGWRRRAGRTSGIGKGLTFGREAGRHRRGRAREAPIHFVIFMVIVVALVNRLPVSGLIFLHLTCVCSTSLARHKHAALVANAHHILLRRRETKKREEESHKSGDYKSPVQSVRARPGRDAFRRLAMFLCVFSVAFVRALFRHRQTRTVSQAQAGERAEPNERRNEQSGCRQLAAEKALTCALAC